MSLNGHPTPLKKDFNDFKQNKKTIADKVKRDMRARTSFLAVLNRLKKEYNYTIYQKEIKMKKILFLSLNVASVLFANGYKIPEQSLSGMALSAANVANAKGADASYYNPANMVFNSNKNSFELLMTYIHLPKVKFENKDNKKNIIEEIKSNLDKSFGNNFNF